MNNESYWIQRHDIVTGEYSVLNNCKYDYDNVCKALNLLNKVYDNEAYYMPLFAGDLYEAY
jgi:hypothetical protein